MRLDVSCQVIVSCLRKQTWAVLQSFSPTESEDFAKEFMSCVKGSLEGTIHDEDLSATSEQAWEKFAKVVVASDDGSFVELNEKFYNHCVKVV